MARVDVRMAGALGMILTAIVIGVLALAHLEVLRPFKDENPDLGRQPGLSAPVTDSARPHHGPDHRSDAQRRKRSSRAKHKRRAARHHRKRRTVVAPVTGRRGPQGRRGRPGKSPPARRPSPQPQPPPPPQQPPRRPTLGDQVKQITHDTTSALPPPAQKPVGDVGDTVGDTVDKVVPPPPPAP